MELKLYSAYLDLQLDPEDNEQMLAFETLCWKHISLHASSHWLQQAQSGALSLQMVLSIDPVTKRKTVGYDQTLNRLTFEFVQAYANLIWPSAEENRSHLTSKTGEQLKAGGQRTRAGSVIKARLARDFGQPCTEQDLVAESIIGRTVREFLKELVMKREMPPLDGYSVELLLQRVLAPAIRYPCPHVGCGRIYAWGEALTHHISLAHPVVGPNLLDDVGLRTRLPSRTESTIQGDTQSANPPSMSTSSQGCNQWIDTQTTGISAPVPLSTNPPLSIPPIFAPKYHDAVFLTPLGLDFTGDRKDKLVGLSCPHFGCQLRFDDWASFDAHERLPHDGGAHLSGL